MSLGNGIDLSKSGQVAIREMRLLHAAGVDVLPGGMEQPGCVAHVRIVDIPNGVAWLIPCPPRMIDVLLTQLAAVVVDNRTTPNH